VAVVVAAAAAAGKRQLTRRIGGEKNQPPPSRRGFFMLSIWLDVDGFSHLTLIGGPSHCGLFFRCPSNTVQHPPEDDPVKR
jgi:hypothetical protein